MHNGKILIMGFQGYNTDFLIPSVSKIDSLNTIYSDAVSGYAKWALDHLEFGVSISPIPTRGADYAHHITASPPRFENLMASLV